jgi:hypothetical protein
MFRGLEPLMKKNILQEAANALYGLSVLDASWESLDEKTQLSLHDALVTNIPRMTVQV